MGLIEVNKISQTTVNQKLSQQKIIRSEAKYQLLDKT